MAWNRRKKVRMAKSIWVGRLAGASVVLVCLALGYVWLRVQMVNIGYQIRDKEKHLSALKKENQVLRMKISVMKSPKNIEAMIRNRQMGLVSTKHWQLVTLPKVQIPGASVRGRETSPHEDRTFVPTLSAKAGSTSYLLESAQTPGRLSLR